MTAKVDIILRSGNLIIAKQTLDDNTLVETIVRSEEPVKMSDWSTFLMFTKGETTSYTLDGEVIDIGRPGETCDTYPVMFPTRLLFGGPTGGEFYCASKLDSSRVSRETLEPKQNMSGHSGLLSILSGKATINKKQYVAPSFVDITEDDVISASSAWLILLN